MDAGAVVAALDAERVEATATLEAAQAEFVRIVEAGESVATDDEHDPEGIGLALERAHVVRAVEHAQARLAAVDRALARLASGDYGRCEGCGMPIPAERLEARPTATTCVRCAAPAGRR